MCVNKSGQNFVRSNSFISSFGQTAAARKATNQEAVKWTEKNCLESVFYSHIRWNIFQLHSCIHSFIFDLMTLVLLVSRWESQYSEVIVTVLQSFRLVLVLRPHLKGLRPGTLWIFDQDTQSGLSQHCNDTITAEDFEAFHNHHGRDWWVCFYCWDTQSHCHHHTVITHCHHCHHCLLNYPEWFYFKF